MMKLKFNSPARALVIVAHPDDETIWMGGFITKHQALDWTIFSLCRASDPDRAPKFRKICQHFKAKAIITDLEDDDKLSIKQTIPLIKNLILNKISGQRYDYVFTHGANGEYGHPRHRGIHRAVRELIKNNLLKTQYLYCFNYAKSSHRKFARPIAKADSDVTIKLTASEYAAKKRIMTNLYGFDPNGIDANYCTNPEAFKLITNQQINH